jgi:hypothetical protein
LPAGDQPVEGAVVVELELLKISVIAGGFGIHPARETALS